MRGSDGGASLNPTQKKTPEDNLPLFELFRSKAQLVDPPSGAVQVPKPIITSFGYASCEELLDSTRDIELRRPDRNVSAGSLTLIIRINKPRTLQAAVDDLLSMKYNKIDCRNVPNCCNDEMLARVIRAGEVAGTLSIGLQASAAFPSISLEGPEFIPPMTQGTNLNGLPKTFDAVVMLLDGVGWGLYRQRPMILISLNDTCLGEQHLQLVGDIN